MILGSHVGMSGKEMFLGSAKEAVSYGADTLMVYTGAPQNTRRKAITELNIDAGWEYLTEHGIHEIVVHAPYIINLGNAVKSETFELAVDFLRLEIERSAAMKAKTLVVHPGSHVNEGADVGIAKIIEGLNEVLTAQTPITVVLETMAGKGSEVGRNFEELARIYDGVKYNDKLRVCFDTCHTHDSGYDLVNDWDGVLKHLDDVLGIDQVAVVHLNDSKNIQGAAKDRHENIGFGQIGFETLHWIASCSELESVPKILESPYVDGHAPYKYEIAMLRAGQFDPDLKQRILQNQP